MARFSDIIGQEQLKELLQGSIKAGKIGHAYIINGERYCGKEFVAKVFAQAIMCENPNDGEPCCECRSCLQAEGRNHPDIIYFQHEKPNSIGVDDIRTGINNTVDIKPYYDGKKIYIVSEAELMTVQAQNALLKTLEEPPEYVVILLLTSNIDSFLQTILSRCVVINFKPVKDKLIKDFLMREVHIPDYKAEICVAFARGNVGKARLLAMSEEFDKVKDEALMVLKNIDSMDTIELIAAIKRISEYKLDINDYLDIFSIWYRDMLLFKATYDANGLVFREDYKYIKNAADKTTYEGIENILDALEKCKQRIRANVNLELTMELFLMSIKEN